MRKKKVDKTLDFSAIVIITILLIKFIPRNKIREAHVAFLFKQVITWIFGLLVVENNLISYPTRLFFEKTNKTSFSFEYFIYPALCSFFNVYYPKKGNYLIKYVYYFLHTSLIILFEVLAVKYTGLIHYKKWKWYWSFITVWLSYYVSHLYYKWFFNGTQMKE
jgi:hypothetical protein